MLGILVHVFLCINEYTQASPHAFKQSSLLYMCYVVGNFATFLDKIVVSIALFVAVTSK